MAAAIHRPRPHCCPVVCLALRTSLPAAPPVHLMQKLMAKQHTLTQLGFPLLEALLRAGGYTQLQRQLQRQLLMQLGVMSYRGDGVAGVLSYFCDGSGASCAGCQDLRSSPAFLSNRAAAKAAKLEELCNTVTAADIHTVFGTHSINTLTGAEVLYKVRNYIRVHRTSLFLLWRLL